MYFIKYTISLLHNIQKMLNINLKLKNSRLRLQVFLNVFIKDANRRK